VTRRRPSTLDDPGFARKIDWNLFRLFHEIAHSGGISAAARRLNRQQPTVSAALKRLEGHLGVALCRRTAQGIDLTPAGRALLALCEEMVATARLVPNAITDAAQGVEGKVTICLVSSLVSPPLDDALAAFHRHHPGVEIKLDVAPWRRVLEALLAGEAEIGIGYDSAPRAGLRYETLFREVQQLYCGPPHRRYGQSINEPSHLSEEAFILTGADEPEELERFRRRHGLGQKVAGRADDLHEAKRLIALGLGLGFLPTLAAEATLWPLLAPALAPSYDIYLITRVGPVPGTLTALFVDELRQRLDFRPNETP